MSFYIENTDNISRPKPEFWLATPNKKIIDRLDGVENPVVQLNFMNQNELRFNLNAFLFDELKHEQYRNPALDLIKNKYMIRFKYNGQIKWFVIDGLEKTSDNKDYIPVTAYFVGKELDKKYIGDLHEIGTTIRAVMSKVLPAVAPNWSIGYIDPKIASVQREYELSDATVTSLLEDIAESTESVVIFNDDRTLDFIHEDNAGTFRGLKIEEETYLKGFTDSFDSQNLTTRLVLFGKDGLTINGINPAGTSYIEDFSYYIKPFKRDSNRNVIEHSDFMSDELCHALLDYEDYFESRREDFEDISDERTGLIREEIEADFKLTETTGIRDRLQERYEILKANNAIEHKRFVTSGTQNLNLRTGAYYVVLAHNKGNLARLSVEGRTYLIGANEDAYIKIKTREPVRPDDTEFVLPIELLSATSNLELTIVESSQDDYEEIDYEKLDVRYNLRKFQDMYLYDLGVLGGIQRRIETLNSRIQNISSSLNPANFLSPELYAERENFVSWGVWREENHTDPRELLEDGLRQLTSHNNVERTTTVDIVDFLQSLEDKDNWDKLQTGDIVRFSNRAFNTRIQAFIKGINIDFDSHSIKLEISDVLDIGSQANKVSKRMASFLSTSNQVDMHKREIADNAEKTNQVMKILEGEWDANKQRILAGNETVEISNQGIMITSPTHPNEKLVAVAGVIAISDDGGETFKQAINTRGVVGEQIIGKIIMGTQLVMENDSGTIRFDNDGLRIRADEFHLLSDDGDNYFESLLNSLNNQFIEYDETVRNYIKEQRESFEQETAQFEISIKNYTSEMMNALSDGVLTAQEMHYLQLQMNLIESEYLQVRNRIVPTIQTNNIDPTIQEKLYQIHHELELDYVYLRDFVRQLEGNEVVVPDETIKNIKDMLSRFKPNIEEVSALMQLALQTIQDNRIAQLEYDQKTLSERLTEEFQGELDDLREAIGEFDDEFMDALSDGILTEVEKRKLSDMLLRLRAEKSDLDERHRLLSNHYTLVDSDAKAELDYSKESLNDTYIALNEIINIIKEQTEISPNDIQTYQLAYENYLTDLEDYTIKYEQATVHMQNSYAEDQASQAQQYAEGLMLEVQGNVDDVDRRVTDFRDEVEGAFKDGIITESERNKLSVHRDMLIKEKSDVISRYNLIVTSEFLVGFYDLEPLIRLRESYGSTHADLLLTIELVMMDDIITKKESDDAMELFDRYVEDLAAFSTELENAVVILGQSKAVALTYEELEQYISIVDFEDELSKLQAQLDGKIVTHYYNYNPTMNNEPAVSWEPSSYDTRLGDLFYNLETGHAFRFLKTGNTYGWQQIEDSDVIKALADSQDALDLADSKRRVFITTPTPPYDIGDLWINEDKELLRARVNKAKDSNFTNADWVIATKYTDDSKANAVQNELAGFKQSQKLEFDDLKGALSSFRDTVEGVFRDGIVTENELRILELQRQHMNREKADVDSGYSQLLQNPLLVGSELQELQTSYNSFNSAHLVLLDKLNKVINDGIVTEDESGQINLMFDDYEIKLKNYKDKFNSTVLYLIDLAQTDANDAMDEARRFDTWRSSSFETSTEAIATRVGESEWSTKFKPEIKGEIDTQLEDLTDELDEKFNVINNNALGLNKALTDTFEDGILTKSEVEVISNSLNILKTDYQNIMKKYDSIYNNSDLKGTPKTSLQTARNNYNTIYNTLTNLINSVVSAGTISSTQKNTYNSNFATYQTRVGQLSNALEVALNAITQEKADKAASGAVNNFHENTIKSQYSTTEQTKSLISQSVNEIDLSGELSKVAQGYAEYEVNRTTYANLTEADGSLMNDAFSYEIAAQRTGDDSSLYAAVFSSLGKGNGWEKTELEVKGQTGSHPELYTAGGNIRLRTMGTSSMQGMEVIYTKYVGSFTNVSRVNSQIEQRADSILLEVERATDGKAIVSKINQTPEEIRLSAGKIVFEVTGRNLEEELENIELTPGPQGEQGRGITNQTVTYRNHTSGTSTPPTTGWTTTPSAIKGQYLWTKTVTTYTTGDPVTTYSVSYNALDGQTGADGTGISSTTVTYAQTASGTTTPTSWSSTRPAPIKGQYLWTRTIISYTNGTSSTAYSTSYSALDGQKGDKGDKGDRGERGATGERGPQGATGTSVSSVTEYYLATNSSSGVTTGTSGWSTSIQTISPSKKYLWNYEKINFSDGSSQNTLPVIIGVYGDKGDTGDTGATGRSITGITEYYLASSSKTGVTRSTSGWTTTMQTTTPSKPYLWNYERITWSSGTTTTYVDPIIIGIHGDKGDKGDKGADGTGVDSTTIHYAIHTSGTTAPTSGWSTNIPSPVKGRYMWTRTRIDYTNGTHSTTYSVAYQATDGQKGNDGTGVSSTSVTYAQTSSGTTTPTSWSSTRPAPIKGQYLWTRTIITYTNGTSSTAYSTSYSALDGQKGDKGDKGDQGPRGIEGPQGPSGQSQYVHVRYSANSSGSGHVPNPTTSTKYIGIAVTNTNTTPTSASAYTWSKYAGEDGARGPQGIKGDPGANGQPTYTWVKYADTPTSGMNDYPDGKKYIGLAFNKTTATESNSYSAYQWSLMPQNIEIGGRNLFRQSHYHKHMHTTGLINNAATSAVVKVEPDTTYTISYTVTESNRLGIYQGNLPNGDISKPFSDTSTIMAHKTTVEGQKINETFTTGSVGEFVFLYLSYNIGSVIEPYLKIEKGNMATDWTPAPEDVDEAINTVGNDLSKTNENLGNLENAMVDKTTVSTLEEALRQLTESYTEGEEARERAVEEFQETLAKVPGIEQDLKDTVSKLVGYEGSIILDPNNGKVTIADNKGSVGVEVTRTAINFIDGGTTVARISNQELWINQGVFTKSLTVGEHALVDVGNGLTTLTWTG